MSCVFRSMYSDRYGNREKERYIKAHTKALAIARASSDKKALDIVTIDMRKMPGVCDYFVIASGTSTTQVRAIADHIARQLREKGERIRHSEGEREGLWVLLDCGDVVSHVFLDRTRRFYDLERLWADAPQARFKEAAPKSRRRRAVKKVSGTAARIRKKSPAKRRSPRRKRR